ncbi:MAG TPA: FecR domain-containing protein [Verrucomicrobiae bacterium]|nr:FecR domain-containing protein [Verrucomicrobiae bacterium]
MLYVLVLVFAVLAGGGYLVLIPVSAVPPLEITQFSGPVELVDAQGKAVKAERGNLLQMGQQLRTGDGGEADLELAGKIKLRLKPNSEIVLAGPLFYEKKPPMRLLLNRGQAFAVTEKNWNGSNIELQTPDLVSRSQGGYYCLRANPQDNSSGIGLMRGKAEVRKKSSPFSWVPVHGLEEVRAGRDVSKAAPQNISKEEWKQMSEIYELTQKSAAVEALQLDLSKQAGSLFDFVFDHGTFYTPKIGYAGREFFKDDNTGEVYLEIEYDVFTKGTFTGMYIKTRNLDLAKYSALEFEMRRVPDEGIPQSMRLELKSKTGIARAFAAKLPKADWEKVSFPLHVRNETFMTELAIVFLHDRVGQDKKGAVQIRRVNLIPAETPAAPQEAAPEAPKETPVPAPAAQVPAAETPAAETPAV